MWYLNTVTIDRIVTTYFIVQIIYCIFDGSSRLGTNELMPVSTVTLKPVLCSAFLTGHPPYRNLSHPQRALDGFRSMRQNGHLTDVFLVAGDAEIPAHRTLLVSFNASLRYA